MQNNPRLQSILTAALVAAILSSGCGERDEIRAYSVPAPVAPKPLETVIAPAPAPAAVAAPDAQQLLAAIVPHKDAVWHFKLMGPAALVKPHSAAFTRFIEGIKFETAKSDGGADIVAPKWSLPKGWVQSPGTGMRYATITVGDGAHAVPLTVFRLGPESGDVLANVQRWAQQVGVNNVTKAKLADMTRAVIVDEQTATLVDVTGSGGGDPSMAGPTRRPAAPPQPQEPEKLVAPAPQGWTVDPNPGQFLLTKYDLTKDGQTASLTISRAGGSPVANMNRWRQQMGLEPWDENGAMKAFEAAKELREGEVGGLPAMIVDVTGPESAGDKRERTLGALTMSRTGEFWFFKLRGPATLVDSQKETFEGFLKSIKFE